MGGSRPKGKGKGKDTGKAGNGKGSGKAGKAREPVYEIKECRIDLKEESRNEVLELIKQLRAAQQANGAGDDDALTVNSDCDDDSESSGSEDICFQGQADTTETDGATADGDANPSSKSTGKAKTGDDEDSDDTENIKPWGFDENSEPEEANGKHRTRHAEKKDRKQLLQQLLVEDVAERKDREAEAPIPDNLKPVRVFITDATKMHIKPKGPIVTPRGGPGALDQLLKKSRTMLGFKGKKALTAYTVSADSKQRTKLTRTAELPDGQLIVVSTEELKVDNNAAPTAPRRDATATQAKALSAVQAAYAKRANRDVASSGPFSALPRERVREMNAELMEQARSYAANDGLKGMRDARAGLPAAGVRAELMQALSRSQVVIVMGETGSGKTTQCPNFILEAACEEGRGGEVSIVCTQPRRLAAISVAERVAEERGERLVAGTRGAVGYAVRLQSLIAANTRLLFCTTGVLLQQLVVSPELAGVTHVVVDEAHERNIHTDFLLTLLRELLKRRADLRVVVMSATLEKGLFSKYFQAVAGSSAIPVVSIAGRTFPLTQRYLEDVYRMVDGRGSRADAAARRGNQPVPAGDSLNDREFENWLRSLRGDGANDPSELLVSPEVTQKADFDLVADLCAVILGGAVGPHGPGTKDDGAVLIFMPGFVEIERCIRALKTHAGVGERAWLLPLYGTMPIEQQHRVFQRAPGPGMRKIIVSTNIAETSITIDDVTHVIDSGHVRETRYDPRSCMSVFSTVWVSKAAAQQRAGRASRVRPGVCWRLYDEKFMETRLPRHTLCEMRRTSLEELVLQLRLLQPDSNPGELLEQAPEPPATLAIGSAVSSLVSIGALLNSPGLPITPLGFHVAHMPVDSRVGKMLIYGSLCRCLAPVLTIAACLAHRSPFSRNFNREKEEQQRKAREARFGSLCSDHLASIAAYDAYQAARLEDRQAAWKLCDELGLSASVLDGMGKLRDRFLQHLVGTGFAEAGAEDGGALVNNHKGDSTLVRCVICAGLFPNVVQVQRERGKSLMVSQKNERCLVHPSSINARQHQDFAANSSWLLYHVKVQTSQIFLQDSTLVGSIPLLLFGGELRLDKSQKHIHLGGLAFRTKKEATAVLLKLLQREIDRLLLVKVANPRADISEQVVPLLNTVTKLLQLDGSSVSGLYRT
eukprot:TRINITY_DN110676_c0_g1_i1.p1 TRINITY_DN110676_c0_g1~~TRINITY_DN110676_c0_g1_i1.p1  ORF type:complete len:1160 (-),score=276.15 TRINITY_DN110676_c0_g1_i1:169-3648(-)